MKKNMISIAILVLLIVNVVLTSIMMISVMSTNKKTAALVGDIAAAVKLDLSAGGDVQEAVAVPMEDTVTYTIADQNILLKKGMVEGKDGTQVTEDKSHYAMISVTLSMNTKHKAYKKYGEDMASREDLIKGIISEVVRQYTMEEASSNSDAIEDEILKQVQDLFDSDFIFDVTLPKLLFQ